MKKIFFSLLLLSSYSFLSAQKTTTPAAKPPVLKTQADSISYILGESAGYNLRQQGFDNVKINMALFNRGLTDVMGKKAPLLPDELANSTITSYYMKMQEVKSKAAIAAGEKFLQQNKTRPEVITTASGLQYEVITQGTGAKLAPIDTFVCNYRGTLIDGTEFDASARRGKPLIMPANQVIAGWAEGLQLMPVGSKFKFYIPYQLGYGPQGQGQIPPYAALIFEVELLDIKKAK